MPPVNEVLGIPAGTIGHYLCQLPADLYGVTAGAATEAIDVSLFHANAGGDVFQAALVVAEPNYSEQLPAGANVPVDR